MKITTFNWKLLACIATLGTVLSPELPVLASRQPLANPLLAETLISQQPSPEIYQQAKEELPEDLYVLYRIIDRLARANGLDQNPWRIGIVPEYNINAFATEVNLIAVHEGILDQLAGDTSALACIVAHEMGHHIKRHIALGEAEKAALIKKIQEETEQEVLAEAEDAKTDATAASVGGGLVRGIFGGIVGNVGGNLLEGQSQQRLEDARQRIEEIVAQKQAELEQRLAEENRTREFEADESGYLYATRAGFEAAGCLRAMAVLSRTPGAEFDTTHPSVPKRTEKLQALMTEHPPQRLAQEGEAILKNSQPLTYDLSKDGESLRINSIRGGSSSDDIDRLFK